MKWLPWIMAAMWLIARFSVRHLMGVSIENAHTFGVLSNVLLIVILVFIAIFYKYKTGNVAEKSFISDLKVCMQSAMKYVIGASAAIFTYYQFLSPEEIPSVQQAHIEAFKTGIATDEGLAQLTAQYPELKKLSREQLIEKKQIEVVASMNVRNQVIGALLALTAVSLVYSLLSVFFWRMMMKR